MTLCFSANQAMLAAKAGAMFISPVPRPARRREHGGDGARRAESSTIYTNYDYETQVLAASIRHPVHVLQAAMIGAHCATMPLGVINQLDKHPLTDIGLAKFLADTKKAAEKAK